MLKYFDATEKFRLLTPLFLIGFLLVALLLQGCAGKPKCDCGECNKVAYGQCIRCADTNCTPLGQSPCCENCTCGPAMPTPAVMPPGN